MHHDLATYVLYYVLQIVGIKASWSLLEGWGCCQEGVLGDWGGDQGGMYLWYLQAEVMVDSYEQTRNFMKIKSQCIQ